MRRACILLFLIPLVSGCFPIAKHFTQERVLASRPAKSSREQILVQESGWADRLLWSWEPNYWHYNVKNRHYFYVTNGTRVALPFLESEDNHLTYVTPMGERDWFALSFGKSPAASIFNETGFVRNRPFEFVDAPLEPIDPKIRFFDSPSRVEVWFYGHYFTPQTKYTVYIFDGDLNVIERKREVTE